MNIQELSREELIKYAIKFNIFACYRYPEFVQERDLIKQRMQELGISNQEVQFRPTIPTDPVLKKII